MILKNKRGQVPWSLVGLFFLVVLGIILGGWFYFHIEQKRIIAEKQKELSLIAQLKADQVSRWRRERLDDGVVQLKNALMSHRIKEFEKNPRSFPIKQEILSWMVSVLNNLNYSNAFLLNPKGQVILVGGNEDEGLGEEILSLLPEVGRGRDVVLTSLFEDRFKHNIHMDLLIPILDPDDPSAAVIGFFIFRIDPYQVLYPLLQSWPVPSLSAETLLLAKEGKDYLCLNELRHQHKAALTLRLPLKIFQQRKNEPVDRPEGLFEFVDYRGKPVLSSLRSISGSNWNLLVKIDIDEISVPTAEKARMIIILVCLLVLVAGTTIGFFWRNQRARYYRQKYELELERDKREKALQEKELRYRTLFNIAQEGILVTKGETISDCNPAAEHLLGAKRRDILGKNFFQFSPEKQPDGWLSQEKGLEMVKKTINQGPQRFEWVHQTPEGNKLDVEVSLSRFHMEGESYLLGLLRDITKKKQAEEQIRNLSRFPLENPNPVLRISQEGIVLFANERSSHLLDFWNYETTRCLPEDWVKLIAEVITSGVKREWEVSCGRVFYSLVIAPIPEEHYVNVYGTDITERKKSEEAQRLLEERLQRAEKMEALGTLAGGVAHDLNNVLGVLVGYSELLMLDAPEGSGLRDHALNILQAGQRATAIIQDLLTLARRGVAVSQTVNLNPIIRDFWKTPEFERLKSDHPTVSFQTDLADELLNIKGSPVHLEKTIMNLLSNGAEAVSGEGEVVIRTENKYVDKSLPGYEETREGEYVQLTVADTGMGISSEDLPRIFEPFYTKKVMGRSGTGLGLAVVWGTVKDHNGYIDVRSKEGEGSSFTLYFPVTRDLLTEDQEALSRSDYLGKGETILVVDDVQEQRALAAAMLGNLGYTVHSVASGEEAVEFLKSRPVDLLILDMIMDPGIDGLETYRRILALRPGQKAIIVSGFSETDRVRQTQALGAGEYVRKPYVLEKIGLAVRRELDGKS